MMEQAPVRQWGFYFDSSLCSGCKACQGACKDKNDLEVGILWRRVYEVQGGGWKKEGGLWVPSLAAYHLSMSCHHCENPICAPACPTKAISGEKKKPHQIDQTKCVKCGVCRDTCRFEAIEVK